MTDFTEKMRLRGKAEEDIYFFKLNKKLIQALHEKQAKQKNQEGETKAGEEIPEQHTDK